MRMYRTYKVLLAAAVTLLPAASCVREEVPVQTGGVTLRLSLGEVLTKADEPDLLVAMVSRNGNVVARYPGATSSCLSMEADAEGLAESVVEFNSVTAGTYSVYALANTAGLDPATRSAFLSAGTRQAIEAVTVLPAPGSPSYAGGAMPLSAKGSVTVNAGHNGQVLLDLQRVFARVSISFKNETGGEITLSDCEVTLKAMNPGNGYLFFRETDTVGGSGDLVISRSGDIVIGNATSSDYALLSELTFPSEAPLQPRGRRYLCDIAFRIGSTPHLFEDLPVHDRRSADIPRVGRNQHLKIETRISKKEDEEDVTFFFDVVDWVDKPQYIEFN